uniref:Uncharacterized protein n=1 Tax=Branchiostoma floridae TaxID=7739 RepID=C3ZUR7_BRAFL|eukprot:XP_002587768.1 hypothetical protein BRAFLDRAFT_94671 [Branchiostoma floridae]
MDIFREYDNPYDKDAYIEDAPALQQTPIARQDIGRLPAGLAKIFAEMDRGGMLCAPTWSTIENSFLLVHGTVWGRCAGSEGQPHQHCSASPDDYSVASEFRCNHERQLKQKEKEEKASEVPTELELCLGKDSQEVHAPEMPTELEPVQDKGKGSQKRHHARHSVAADNPAQDGDHFSVSDRDGCPRVCVSGDRSLKTATLTKQPKKWRRC